MASANSGKHFWTIVGALAIVGWLAVISWFLLGNPFGLSEETREGLAFPFLVAGFLLTVIEIVFRPRTRWVGLSAAALGLTSGALVGADDTSKAFEHDEFAIVGLALFAALLLVLIPVAVIMWFLTPTTEESEEAKKRDPKSEQQKDRLPKKLN